MRSTGSWRSATTVPLSCRPYLGDSSVTDRSRAAWDQHGGIRRSRHPDPGAEGVFTVGYFARIAPEKGLHCSRRRTSACAERTAATPMRLEVAGYLARANQSLSRCGARGRSRLRDAGAEFSYRGELDRAGKLAFLRQLDVLSVPATYDEPKGMFLLEAMASGVPVVQPRRGAFVEMVERTGGGLLVAPDDPDALAEGLHAVWSSAGRTGRHWQTRAVPRRQNPLHRVAVGRTAHRAL